MIDDIIEKAKVEKKKLFIYTHKMPDIDSIFAAYALKEYLALFGVQSKYVMGTSHKKFRVERNTDTTNSISVILDTVTVGQAESNRFLKSWKNDIYVYDHHSRTSTNNQFIEEELCLPKSNVIRISNITSTCEVLFRDFNTKKITPQIAYFLLTGILANTGILRHPKEGTFDCVRTLMALGANFDGCTKEILASKLKVEVGIAEAMKNVKKIPLGNLFCLVLYLNHDKVKFYEQNYDIRNIHKKINKLNNIEDCPICMIIAENSPGEFDVRIRSNETYGNYSAHKIAEKYNGGGNHFAAGCHFSTNKGFDGEKIVKMLLKDIYEKFQEESTEKEPIVLNSADKELKELLYVTKHLTSGVSQDVINRLEVLKNSNAHFEYVVNGFQSYEKFMLKNEILGKIPLDDCNDKYPTIKLELSEEETAALKDKLGVTDEDILKTIFGFRNIKMHSIEIVLPSGESNKRTNFTEPPPSQNFNLR